MAEIAILPFSGRQQFNSLFERTDLAEGHYLWFQSLIGTLAPGEEAVFAVAFIDGEAKAALPLVRKGTRMRALTAPYTTIYAPALPDPQWARRLGKAAATYVGGSLLLDALDPSHPGVAAYLEGLEASGLFTARYCHFRNHYEAIANFEEYWNARPSRLKATVRRKLAQAQAEGAEFCCYREGVKEAVSMYDEVYRASWKPSEPHPQFIANMVEKLARSRSVRVGIMTLAGRPIAAQIWLVYGRKATIFKLAYRQDSARYSPGTLLTHWLISTLGREDDLEEVDFGRGGDSYKVDWLKESRLRIGLIAGNLKSRDGLGSIASEVLPTRIAAMLNHRFNGLLRNVRLMRRE